MFSSKFGKYFVFLMLFMFVMTIVADAFTTIRQEELGGTKPMTRAQRKARQRRLQGKVEENTHEPSPISTPTFIHEESSSNSGGSSSNSATPSNFVKSSENPTPTPTVDQQVEQEKKEKARKTSNTVVVIMVLLIVGGVAGWYFTRNVNFKKLKQ